MTAQWEPQQLQEHRTPSTCLLPAFRRNHENNKKLFLNDILDVNQSLEYDFWVALFIGDCIFILGIEKLITSHWIKLFRIFNQTVFEQS